MINNPTAQDAIDALIVTEGNLDFAAERLFGTNETGSNKSKLVALIARDPSIQQELHRTIRTLSVLQAFSLFKTIALVVEGTLENLDPSARVRMLDNVMSTISTLTDEHTSTVNTNSKNVSVQLGQSVLNQLPPDVRDAIKTLATSNDAPELAEPSPTDGHSESESSVWDLPNIAKGKQ